MKTLQLIVLVLVLCCLLCGLQAKEAKHNNINTTSTPTSATMRETTTINNDDCVKNMTTLMGNRSESEDVIKCCTKLLICEYCNKKEVDYCTKEEPCIAQYNLTMESCNELDKMSIALKVGIALGLFLIISLIIAICSVAHRKKREKKHFYMDNHMNLDSNCESSNSNAAASSSAASSSNCSSSNASSSNASSSNASSSNASSSNASSSNASSSSAVSSSSAAPNSNVSSNSKVYPSKAPGVAVPSCSKVSHGVSSAPVTSLKPHNNFKPQPKDTPDISTIRRAVAI